MSNDICKEVITKSPTCSTVLKNPCANYFTSVHFSNNDHNTSLQRASVCRHFRVGPAHRDVTTARPRGSGGQERPWRHQVQQILVWDKCTHTDTSSCGVLIYSRSLCVTYCFSYLTSKAVLISLNMLFLVKTNPFILFYINIKYKLACWILCKVRHCIQNTSSQDFFESMENQQKRIAIA